MTFKNTINTTKETLKKQAKNLALSTAIIASLTSCGPTDKKAKTTTPTDSTKTEVVAKDSVKKVNNSIEKDTKEKEINSIEDLDPELQAMIKDADIKLEEEKLTEEKQAPREKLNQPKEMYESYLNLCQMQENTILESYRKAGQNEEVIAELKEIIKEYHKNRKKINRPIPPKVQKVINICEKKKE